jgi:hypothetical protein
VECVRWGKTSMARRWYPIQFAPSRQRLPQGANICTIPKAGGDGDRVPTTSLCFLLDMPSLPSASPPRRHNRQHHRAKPAIEPRNPNRCDSNTVAAHPFAPTPSHHTPSHPYPARSTPHPSPSHSLANPRSPNIVLTCCASSSWHVQAGGCAWSPCRDRGSFCPRR